FLFIEIDDVTENYLDVSCVSENAPDRLGDLAGVEHSGRNLVEKRLEDVMIFTVDQRDPDRFICKSLGRPQAAKSAADYYNLWLFFHISTPTLKTRYMLVKSITNK